MALHSKSVSFYLKTIEMSTWPCFSVSNNSFYSNHFPGFFKQFIFGCYEKKCYPLNQLMKMSACNSYWMGVMSLH